MLFAVKNRLGPSLILAALLLLAATTAKYLLGLEWDLSVRPILLGYLLPALALMIGSDGLLHGVFWAMFGERYLARYRALVNYFSRQRAPEIIAGGLLAGAEELVFRGIVLEWLLAVAEWPPLAAMVAAGLAFGLLHVIPSRSLWPIAIWAAWEGVLLSLVYVVSGSLALSVAVHSLHDVFGFSLFAHQRRSGWMLGG